MKSCVGGTFDHLHVGHRALLKEAFSKSDFVLIGISSDKLASETHKYKSNLQSLIDRKTALTNFLYEIDALDRAKIDIINDPIGTTIKYEDLKAIFCTDETRKSAETVNKRRLMRALPSLKIFEIPLVEAEDGLRISSERIRRGIINEEGKVLKWTGKTAGFSLK